MTRILNKPWLYYCSSTQSIRKDGILRCLWNMTAVYSFLATAFIPFLLCFLAKRMFLRNLGQTCRYKSRLWESWTPMPEHGGAIISRISIAQKKNIYSVRLMSVSCAKIIYRKMKGGGITLWSSKLRTNRTREKPKASDDNVKTGQLTLTSCLYHHPTMRQNSKVYWKNTNSWL